MRRAIGAVAVVTALAACNPQPPRHVGRATPAPSPTQTGVPPLQITGRGTRLQPVRIVAQSGNRKLYRLLAKSYVSNAAQAGAQATFSQADVTFYASNGTTMQAQAPKATLDEHRKAVMMSGGVHATTSTGSTLTCDRLRYDRSTGTITGEGNVRITGTQGGSREVLMGNQLCFGRHADADDHAVNGKPEAILLRDLLKRYGRRTVVNNVSANVRTGEIVGLLGPNGAGKTTTFYMVVGLVKPDGGAVVLQGENGDIELTGSPMYRRARSGIGYLAQETSVFRKLSVADNLRLIWEMRGVPRVEQELRLKPLLAEFGLEQFADARADSLSGGERRRVEIARALATEPAFLLLDEPFTGIDPIAVADIQTMIKQLRDRGLGVLITDHQVRETLTIVDRAYLLNNGKVEVAGTAQEVLESPIARKFYLGESFRL